VAELEVLTDRPEAELAGLADRGSVAALLRPSHCGDQAACDAVRQALLDEQVTRLQVVERPDADVERRMDMDAAAEALEPAARSSLARSRRVIAIRVATAAADRQLAVRAAFAGAAAISEKVDGLVRDALLGRIETARVFATHAVTTPLAASAFSHDRVRLLFQPRGEGLVRIVTAGLARWGAPDVEAPAVVAPASARVGEIVLGVAAALAQGTLQTPVVLTREDIERARGAPYPGDAGLPEVQPVSIGLVSVQPEGGDANDFLATVVPPAGEGPMGFLDMAERFFGRTFATAPVEEAARAEAGAGRLQQRLTDALAKWKEGHEQGAKLFVRLPFQIPGTEGSESLWIEVTGFDERTIKGTVVDEPLAATDVEKGQEVTRRRGEVQEVREK
jgi:hypothetical protein